MVLTPHIIFVSMEVCSMNIKLTDQLGFLASDSLVTFSTVLELQKLPLYQVFSIIYHFHLRNGNLNSGAHEWIENILSIESQKPKHII